LRRGLGAFDGRVDAVVLRAVVVGHGASGGTGTLWIGRRLGRERPFQGL